MTSQLPERLYLVRHGQSTGNVAHADASAAQAERLALDVRDADIPLSDLGAEQAGSLGRFLAGLPGGEEPTAVLSSPYLRARETARLALAAAGRPLADLTVRLDERLRDRDIGIVEGLTALGIARQHPELAAARARIGKYYHRLPGGEAWTDVLLRLRSVHETLVAHHGGERVVVFTHDVVVLLFRALYEELDETTVTSLARTDPVRNASVTTFVRHAGRLRLRTYNDVPTG